MTYCGDIPPLAILDKMPAMVYISNNVTKTIRWCNPYMEKLTGYSLEEIQDAGITFFSSIMHPVGFQKAIEAQQKFIQGVEKFSGFCRIKPKRSESWIWLFGVATPFSHDEEGNTEEVICVFQELDCSNTPFQLELVIQSLVQKEMEEYLHSLTHREKEVFQYMIKGEDNNTIAKLLDIDISTVKIHRKHLRKKLGISKTHLFLYSLTSI